MNRSGMLLRVIAKAFWFHPARISASLAALTVGATLCSAFLSLYFVLPSKMSGEFRTLGPNLVVAPREGEQTFSTASFQRLESSQPQAQAVPWLYAVGTAADRSVVMGGTDLARAASLNPGWRVVAAEAANSSGEALQDFLKSNAGALQNQSWVLAGAQAASHFGWTAGQTVELAYGDKKIKLPLRAVISSGQSEDSQVLLPLSALQGLTAQPGRLSLIQARVPGAAADVESRRREIAALLPELEARPLRQVVEAETGVVMKVQALMYGLTAVVLGIVILSVMTTFSGLVLDRQKDIGIMKTLGGGDGIISILFIAEAAAAALIAAAFGHSIGFGLAAWAASGIFHSTLPWRWDVLASVVGVTLAVALIATTIPIRLVRKLEPVEILKGS